MALTTINSGGVKDDSIVNADIKSDAAIAGSKVAPDFGSQNIITTGTVGSGDITLTKPGSAANAKLEIAQSGGGGGTSEILFSDATSGRGRIFFNHGSNPEVLNLEAAGTIGLSVTTAGKVGIGTTSPGYKLHVAEGTTDVVASFTSSDANAWIQLRDDHTNDTAVMIGANDDSMMLRAGSNTRMLIAHNGNVGIGTESPKSFSTQISLTINGPSVGRLDCIADGGGGGGIYGTATSTKVFANSGSTLYLDTAASTDLRLSVNGTDIAKVKSNKDFEIVDGNLVVASGHGIDFSASSNQSGVFTGGETLTDYEAGTYTPNLLAHGGSWVTASLSSGNKYGSYVKIGNMVHVQAYFTDFHLDSAHDGDLVGISLPITPDSGNTGYSALTTVHANCFVSGKQTNFFVATGNARAYGIQEASTSYDTWRGEATRYLLVAGTYRAS